MKRVWFAIILLSVVLAAQDKPAISEISRLRILNAYQRALFLQKLLQDAQAQLQQAADNYNKVAEHEAEENKLPKGTSFRVNPDAGEVEIVLPAPPPPKQPEKK